MRDKIYAHNDKILYRDWDIERDATIDDPLQDKVVELLRWAKASVALDVYGGFDVPTYWLGTII